MNKSENYGFNLPSRDNPEDLADVNKISENFSSIDKILFEHEEEIDKKVEGEKTESVNEESTENEIPSAKAVYDALKNIDIETDDAFSYSSKNPVQNKVISKNVAAAIKNSASGNPLRLDDVSPLEHEIAVGLKSKNLLVYPYIQTTKTEKGITFTDNGDGTITINGTATGNAYFAMSLVSFSKGVSYTLSGNPITDNSVQTYLESGGIGVYDKGYGKTFTPTKDFESKVTILAISGSSLNNVIVKPLLEIGTTATAYTPYVDFTKDYMVGGIVTDTDFSFPSGNVSYTEDTFVQVTGANTSDNGTLTFNNGDVWRGSGQLTSSIDGNLGEEFSVGDWACISPSKVGDASILELHKATKVDKTVQRRGSIATESEPYVEPTTYTADENGNVAIPSLYPTTTLIADNGAIISAEYNVDTKKYIDKKFAELAAMIVSQ